MGEVDPAFVQLEEHRSKLQIVEVEEIPVIDLFDTGKLISEIRNACKNWGFFQVTNHGVPSELRIRVERVAKRFFDLPMEEKKKVQRDAMHPMGYHDSEHTKNVRDWKEVFDFFLQDPTVVPASLERGDQELRTLTNQWPEYPPEFREVCEEYIREMEKLAFKLLELVTLSLGLPADRLKRHFKEQTSFLRFNHYPPCPNPELALGVGQHRDGSALTVLAQDDVGGLQVMKDGEWIPVRPVPDSFIINVGSNMQVWSNDAYESVNHRAVVNTKRERFSIPFFFHPAPSAMIRPLEELVSEQNPAKYAEFNWGKFFVARNRSDYQKQDVENIQIDHFKKSE
ncbi:hypothetical protein SLA2020_141560 [Shorea laevis]